MLPAMLLAFVVGSWPLQDSTVLVPLGRADGVLPREFSQIRGVRELRDGRVLVTDWVDEVLLVADLRSGTVRQIGRKGSGPKEYRLPASLLPLPGDSTLLVDQGNERLAVVGPDLSIVRSFSSHREGLTHTVIPRGVDSAGRFYFEIPNWTRPDAGPNDSVIVARWDPRTGREEPIGRVRAETFRKPGRRMQPGLPYVIFAPQDEWQVDRGGRVAFVRSADYHVEWRDPAAGRLTRGPATPYRPLAVSAADRTDHVRRFLTSSPIGGRGISGLAATPAAMSSPEAIARMVPNQEFAAVRPPFTDFTPRIAADGTLWVERSVPAGAPRVFDLFDRQGVRRQAVSLPPGRRLLALGARMLYLAAVDDDGVERLERYRLPAALP
jgi:hypothetical protein